MRVREYQLKELAEARKLQDELARLHVPSPVLSWSYEIKDTDGTIVENGIGKSNSFTRNALNALSYYVGLADYHACSTVFADGVISRKDSAGTVVNPSSTYQYFRASDTNPVVYLGGDSTAESLESYTIPTTTLTAISSTVVSSTFDSTNRKLITLMRQAYFNGTGSAVDVVEAAVCVYSYGSYAVLMIRDVFTAVSVAAGQTIEWTYATEVAYPNP